MGWVPQKQPKMGIRVPGFFLRECSRENLQCNEGSRIGQGMNPGKDMCSSDPRRALEQGLYHQIFLFWGKRTGFLHLHLLISPLLTVGCFWKRGSLADIPEWATTPRLRMALRRSRSCKMAEQMGALPQLLRVSAHIVHSTENNRPLLLHCLKMCLRTSGFQTSTCMRITPRAC